MHSNLKKDYLWNTVGVFAQNAISPLLLIVITRFNGINASGIFSFAFSVALIFWALGMWGGRTFQVSDVKHEFSQRSYIMVRLLLTVVMLLGAVLFSLANHYDATKSGIIIVLVVFKIFESIADAIYGVLQVHARLFIAGKALFYKAVAGFSLFIIIDLLTKSILLGSVGIVAANVLLVFLYDIPNARRVENIHIERLQIKHYVGEASRIIKRCAPISVVIFLSMFSLNIPRYFVDLYHPNQIGYFGIIAMPITLIVLLMVFILQPRVVSLSNFYEEGQYTEFHKTIANLSLITVSIGAVILLVAFIIGIPALHLVFGANFSHYKTALMIIILGGIFNALVSILINILTITRRFRGQFYVLLLTNIVLTVCSALIIKRHGLLGGVILFAGINLIQVGLLTGIYLKTLRVVHLIGYSNKISD